MSIFRILKDSFYYGVIPKITTIVNVLLLPIITPYLTPYDYGIWGLVTSYVGLVVAIVPLGLHMHLSNSYFEYKQWRLVWGRILYLFLLVGFIGSLIYIVLLLFALVEVPLGTRLGISICSCFPILLFGNNVIASHIYPLKNNPKPLVFRNLVAGLSAILVSFIFIYIFKLGYWGFIFGSMASATVGFVLFIPPLYIKEDIKPIIERKIRRVKGWLRISFPVIPHTIGFMLLASSGRIIMSFYHVSIDDIGLFSNGYIMGDYITIVATSLAVALSPQLQRAYRGANYTVYRRLYYLCQGLTIAAVFLFSIWMPEIYKLLIRNSRFDDAIPIASFICFANVLMPLYLFVSTIVFIEKRTINLLWLVFLPGMVNVTLCLFFVPIGGYKAVMYSTLIAFWSQLLVPFLSKYHRERLRLWLGSQYKLLVLLCIITLALIISQAVSSLGVCWKVLLTLFWVITGWGIYRMKGKIMLLQNLN